MNKCESYFNRNIPMELNQAEIELINRYRCHSRIRYEKRQMECYDIITNASEPIPLKEIDNRACKEGKLSTCDTYRDEVSSLCSAGLLHTGLAFNRFTVYSVNK